MTGEQAFRFRSMGLWSLYMALAAAVCSFPDDLTFVGRLQALGQILVIGSVLGLTYALVLSRFRKAEPLQRCLAGALAGTLLILVVQVTGIGRNPDHDSTTLDMMFQWFVGVFVGGAIPLLPGLGGPTRPSGPEST